MKSVLTAVVVGVVMVVALISSPVVLRWVSVETAVAAEQSQRSQANPGTAERLVGAWQLDSRTVTRSDGTVVADAVLGERPLGRLFYDASGTMMLQMMRLNRKAAISTPAEAKGGTTPRVVLGYDAYFGRYTVDERAGTITHRVEASLFPEDLV